MPFMWLLISGVPATYLSWRVHGPHVAGGDREGENRVFPKYLFILTSWPHRATYPPWRVHGPHVAPCLSGIPVYVFLYSEN